MSIPSAEPGSTRAPEPDYWRTAGEIAQTLDALDGRPDDDQFRLMADHLPILCWIARGDGYIAWYNRRWHDYCGTTPEAMKGWGWRDVHHPDALAGVMESWTRSVAEGSPFEMVFPLRGADGRHRPFLTRVIPLRDASGEVVRWFGVNVDVAAQVRAETERDESDAKFRTLTDAMPQMVWSTRPDGFHDYYNAQWYAFTGVPPGSTDGEAWNGMFHPDDQEGAWARWRRSLATGEPYEIEYRLRHRSGQYRWTLGRALPVRDEAGRITRWIGTCTDIHDSRLAFEQNALLNRELSHRIKNIFAIISGLIGLSARREPTARTFARDLQNRISALSRAHEFARPHSDESRPATPEMMLHGMMAELFSPYAEPGDPRITITGRDVPVDDKGATPLALVFHELATNAAKYGALALPGGRIEVVTTLDADDLAVVWTEHDGPPIDSPPTRQGFGTQLAIMSVEQQLGGRFEREWRRNGLRAVMRLNASRLARTEPTAT